MRRLLRPFAKAWRLLLIIFCRKRWGTRSLRPNWTNILVQRMSRVCEPPKVNPSIWSQLLTNIKAQDVRSQKGQNTLIGPVTAMTKAADLALGKYSQDKELITLLTDAVAMALQYNHKVNHSRRLAKKKEMHKDYAGLCNLSTVDGTSEYLFRDLSKLAKDITEANKGFAPNIPGIAVTISTLGAQHLARTSEDSSLTVEENPLIFLGKSRFSKPQRKKKDCKTSQRQ